MKKHGKLLTKKIIRMVRKQGLQKRFLLLVVCVIILPLLFLETATFYSVKKAFESRNFETMQQELDSYNSLVNNRLTEYSSVGNRIATSLYTIKMLEKTSSDKQLYDFIQANEYDKQLDDWTGDLDEYIAVEVISKKGFITSKPYRFVDNDLKNSELFNHIMEQDKRRVWLGAYDWENKDRYTSPPGKQDFQYPLVVSTKVKGAYSSDYLGCVNLYIKQSFMIELVTEVLNYREENKSLFTEEELFFIDDDGKIISHKDASMIGTSIPQELEENLEENTVNDPKSRVVYLDQGKERKLVFFSESELTGMRVIGLVDYDEFYQVINHIFRMVLFFSILVLVIAGVISWLYFISIRTPISQIMWGMKKVEKNDFTVVVEDDGNDELTDLTQRFNKMVRKTGELIEQKIFMEREKKDAELRVLEEQINPHFLYNTLDMINWIAYEKNDEKICHIIEALSDFYRLGLNSGERIYTVEQEIKHVRAYVEIQKERFQGKINYFFDIQEETYPYDMVKIVLQPLVENAIVHGIIPKETQGNIWISVQKKGQEIVFTVLDDGVGLHNNRNKSRKNMSGSYGLHNVDERIKLYFGKEYGVTLESGKEGVGVAAVIRIPALMGGKKDENFIGG